MSNETFITSPQNPRVKALARLRDQRGRRRAGRFIAEGHRAVSRAIGAGLRIESIWTCADFLSAASELADKVDCERVAVSAAVFRKIAYVREPEGILAVCEPPSWSIDALPPVDASSLDLVAVGTAKPGNLGAMVRTADLAGCRAVLAAGAPVDAMNPNAIRASTGSVFTLPTLSMREDEAIGALLGSGVRILAAVVDGAVEHTQANYAGPCAIVIGPEDTGLDQAWRDAAAASQGQTIRIATRARAADSLNASVAAGILLFEATRQRARPELQ
ncbi:MAG: TrmH family RNA methyltransferase [Phycisphaeraceae bacterium]